MSRKTFGEAIDSVIVGNNEKVGNDLTAATAQADLQYLAIKEM